MIHDNKGLATDSFVSRWRDRRKEKDKTLMLVLVTIAFGITTILSVYMFFLYYLQI